jgi:hypothetical protein
MVVFRTSPFWHDRFRAPLSALRAEAAAEEVEAGQLYSIVDVWLRRAVWV